MIMKSQSSFNQSNHSNAELECGGLTDAEASPIPHPTFPAARARLPCCRITLSTMKKTTVLMIRIRHTGPGDNIESTSS